MDREEERREEDITSYLKRSTNALEGVEGGAIDVKMECNNCEYQSVLDMFMGTASR